MKVQTTAIRATSRASVKIRDNYFTVEYSEERTITYDPEEAVDETVLNNERQKLWDDCNDEIYNQISEIRENARR